MDFAKNDLKSFELATGKEWLLTNGIGGFASSTIIGANTNKYHGLLVAALRPPVERFLLLSKLQEQLFIDDKEYLLDVNETYGGIYPQGFRYLQLFSQHPLPTYTYQIGDVILEKIIYMVYGQNTTVVRYNLYANPDRQVRLEITPMVNYRDYHSVNRKNDWPFHQQMMDNGVQIKAFDEAAALYLYGEGAKYQQGSGCWFEGIKYRVEVSRGENPWEDHYVPGVFRADLTDQGSVAIIASTEKLAKTTAHLWQVKEERRLSEVVEKAGYQDAFINQLVLAADHFIVRRASTGTKTVIAGYHWFTDWGRDTMIALPGLTLVTKRYDEAKEILLTFAKYCKDGLIPNRFPDDDQDEPAYNTVDASLWFFQAVYKFLKYTGDNDFIKSQIYPVLKEIIAWHVRGTHFDIKLDSDGLLKAGNSETQLTWMDAKVDGWVVTPRHGKPVEINALWFNALKIMEMLSRRYGEDSTGFRTKAAATKKAFIKQFWNEEASCLYDVIGEDGTPDPSIRPNQILAVALPYTMLDDTKEKKVVYRVWKDLYTPYGLRSLSPDHPDYRGSYVGDRYQRDGAYHQGTVWSWLMGSFITAFRKVHEYSPESQIVAEIFIRPLKAHLHDHGIGSISEIFEGNEPFEPRGCIAQAWGVAEVLRAYMEDVLEVQPDKG